jgi:hypothetical protein
MHNITRRGVRTLVVPVGVAARRQISLLQRRSQGLALVSRVPAPVPPEGVGGFDSYEQFLADPGDWYVSETSVDVSRCPNSGRRAVSSIRS